MRKACTYQTHELSNIFSSRVYVWLISPREPTRLLYFSLKKCSQLENFSFGKICEEKEKDNEKMFEFNFIASEARKLLFEEMLIFR